MNHAVWSRPSRRQLVQGVGVAGLGLVVGCEQLFSRPQQPPRVPRVGWLSAGYPGVSPLYEAFHQGLRELGYVEGRNVAIEQRFAEQGDAQLPDFAAELTRLPVDVIVAGGPFATRAARNATETIPIVMIAGSLNPVRDGYAASLAWPGGNLTGLTTAPTGVLYEKLLELLKEVAPDLSRVALLWDASFGPLSALGYEGAAAHLGVELQPLDVRSAGDFEGAFEVATRAQVGGVLMHGTPLMQANRARIAELATRSRLPAAGHFREFAEAGILMAYGPNLARIYHRAATYVDKILKGTNPGDVPIEQPMTFEFVINLRTAQALGLTIPQSVLVQATELLQ